MDLRTRLEAFRQEEQRLNWEGTFADYFDQVVKRPQTARLAHARIYDMITAAGVETDPHGEKRYRFFEDEIFGLDETIDQLVEYFHSAAQRLEVRKRILLLMGPVGGGKSTIVSMLKRGLERYSRTDDGRRLRHQGLPDARGAAAPHPGRPARRGGARVRPLHRGRPLPRLPPDAARRLQGRGRGRAASSASPSPRSTACGIGTFSPSDPKTQDITELTGSIDLSTIGEYGVESDPRAYRFDGELNIANRGLMEFIEMLKCDEKFLYVLLTLSQEQNIKTGRFSMIYADEVIVSHTNETRVRRLRRQPEDRGAPGPHHPRQGALQPARLGRGADLREAAQPERPRSSVHIAPNTLRIATIFAVLSRLEEPKKAGMSLMKKLKLYDGEEVEDFTTKDVRELQDEAVREGMDGISPRYVINRLSGALVRDGVTCINPIDALRALRDGLEQHTAIKREDRERLLNLIAEARRSTTSWPRRRSRRPSSTPSRRAPAPCFNNYLDNVEAFCNKQKIKDPITEEEVEPDEKLMRSIEEQIGVSENGQEDLPRGDPDPHLLPGPARARASTTAPTSACARRSRRSSSPTCATWSRSPPPPRPRTRSSCAGSTRWSTA